MVQAALFKTNPQCAVCKQRILRMEDAQMDHIVPFAENGLTCPSNAQLLHTVCNQQKGKRLQEDSSSFSVETQHGNGVSST